MSEATDRQKQLFEEALSLPSTEARDAYLEAACGEDEALREEIESLLEVYAGAGRFIPTRAAAAAEAVGASLSPGSVIDRYKLLAKIGEGGMGVVYLAEQDQPVRRRVALKVIKLGMDTRQVVARFEAERQALALMDHPNIARVFDGGATSTGRPYFVMELVQGVPITEFCDKNHLSPKERLKLFVEVCQAVQSAHQKGIIHRDIKPTNILVTLNGGQPTPKVIDFGIAKAIHQRLTDKTIFTHYATLIGTPAYMSPEQAEISRHCLGDIDTRTDVYSLGVLLYELLTSTTPFPDERLRSAGYGELQRIITQEEPERPSSRLSTGRAPQRRRLAKNGGGASLSIPDFDLGDLDWIVMKCLEKDRARRYETANGLIMDIQRYAANEPVVARPPSPWYRLRKFATRNRVAFAAGVAVLFALFLGLGLASLGFVQAHRRLQQAQQQQRIAQVRAYSSDMNNALTAVRKYQVSRAMELLDRYIPRRGEPDLRGFEWRYIWGQCQGDSLCALPGTTQGSVSARFSSDGRKVFSIGDNGLIGIWDAESKLAITTWRAQTNVRVVAFSPSGQYVALENHSGQLALWSLPERELLATAQIQDSQASGRLLALSPDDKLLASADGDGGSVHVWTLPSLQGVRVFSTGASGVCALTFSPDGRLLAVGGADGSIMLWNVLRQEGHELPSQRGSIHGLSFSPDSQMLAVLTWRSGLKLLRVPSGKLLEDLERAGFNHAAAFSPDGRKIALLADDSAVRLWKLANGRAEGPTLVFPGHRIPISTIAFSPDGRLLVTGASDHTFRITPAAPRPEKDVLYGHANTVLSVAVSPDNRTIASGDAEGAVRLWDAKSGQALAKLEAGRPGQDWIWSTAFSADGRLLAASGGDYIKTNVAGPLKIWDVDSLREPRFTFEGSRGCVGYAQFGPAGRTLFSTSNDQWVRAWEFGTGKVSTFSVAVEGRSMLSATSGLSPNGNTLATAGWGTGVRLWNIQTGKLITILTNGLQTYYSVRFSKDGRWLAAGRADGTAEVWNTGTWTVTSIANLSGAVWGIAFSPDGKTLATGCDGDPVILLWSLETFECVGMLEGDTGSAQALDFSADGTALVSGGSDRTIRIWRAPGFTQIAQTQL